ncbi:MAG: beta-Ala-His dipeptidase [Candidatus Ozemobacteraceae bacterium]
MKNRLENNLCIVRTLFFAAFWGISFVSAQSHTGPREVHADSAQLSKSRLLSAGLETNEKKEIPGFMETKSHRGASGSGSIENSWYKGLETHLLWKNFLEISGFPRESKHEKALVDHIIERARAAGREYRHDEVGNLVIRIPATQGREKAAITVLQAHLDMVCVKTTESTHDFARDPIEVMCENGLVKAKNTTLGADDGIGVAALLAILDGGVADHGPLELLFTIDEEGDYTGVSALTPDFFQGRTLINLDAEEAHQADIGCAGGQADTFTFPLRKTSVELPCRAFQLRVSGLLGGHSGVDIHRGRGNAIRLLGRLLRGVAELPGARLVSLSGGTVDTAIPTEAEAVVFVAGLPDHEVECLVDTYRNCFARELAFSDPKVKIRVRRDLIDVAHERYATSEEDTKRIAEFLAGFPQGVLRMSAVFPDTAELSANPGVLRIVGNDISLTAHLQSVYPEAKLHLAARMKNWGKSHQFSAKSGEPYPSWQPNPNSPILHLASWVHQDVFGRKLATRVVHAGLECGVLAGSIPKIDMIALGPTIRNGHSPAESVDVATVEEFWNFLKALLKRLS